MINIFVLLKDNTIYNIVNIMVRSANKMNHRMNFFVASDGYSFVVAINICDNIIVERYNIKQYLNQPIRISTY